MTTARKAELIAAGIVVLLCGVFLVGYIHEREARAAFQAEAKVREQAQADGKQQIEQIRVSMQAQLDAISRQKQTLIAQPQQAPIVIRENVPFSQPLQQTQAVTKETPPDAPVAQLTAKQEVELAQYALNCKQCGIERDGLKQQAVEKDKIIASQAEELKQAKVAIKGGPKKQRFVTAMKWIVIGGLVGYAAHR